MKLKGNVDIKFALIVNIGSMRIHKLFSKKKKSVISVTFEIIFLSYANIVFVLLSLRIFYNNISKIMVF